MVIKSAVLEKIPNLVYGFGTLEEPLSVPLLKSSWETNRPQWKQVHGVSVAHVQKIRQECGEVDALYTFEMDLPIGVVTADCVPILMSDHLGSKVVAIHAGWRGTLNRIVRQVWKELSGHGENPKNWVAAIGPAIGPCCYEVSEEVAANFVNQFKNIGPAKISPRHRILDLQAINSEELREIGISEVEVIQMCTRCTPGPLFNSYRRSKEEGLASGRQWSVISRYKT